MKPFDQSDNVNDHEAQVSRVARLVTIGVLLILLFLKLKPVLEQVRYAKERYFFTGSTSDGESGYIEKVDELLRRYVKECGLDTADLRQELARGSNTVELGDGHKFTFLVGDGGELASLRLIGLRQFGGLADSLFFYNSLLPEHLAQQLKFPDRRIFTIHFRVDPTSGRLSIRAITIDRNILSAPLIAKPNFWSANVTVATDSIFRDFLFLKLPTVWLPIGNMTGDSAANINAWGNNPDRTVDFLRGDTSEQLIEGSLLDGDRIYRIRFGGNKYLQLSKRKNILYLFSANLGDIQLLRLGGADTFFIGAGNRARVPLDGHPFELRMKGLAGSGWATLYGTSENPFRTISSVAHHNRADFRFAVSQQEADMYSSVVARLIPDIENMFAPAQRTGGRSCDLSYNPVLARYLEEQIAQYIDSTAFLRPYKTKRLQNAIQMGVTIMDTKTAQVLALPWFSNSIDASADLRQVSNYNLVNHTVGSCFKPLLYLASYRRFPNLSNLMLTPNMVSDYRAFEAASVPRAKPLPVELLGYPTTRFFGDSKGSGESLSPALGRSSNLFPVLTFLYSVTEPNDPLYRELAEGARFPVPLFRNRKEHTSACKVANGRLFMSGLVRNELTQIYKSMYDVEDINPASSDRDIFEYDFWKSDRLKDQSGQKLLNYGLLSPEKVSLHFEIFDDGERAARPEADFRNGMVSWILGSQNNRWNNAKLCEAFTRVITGQRLSGRVTTGPADTIPNLFDHLLDLPTLSHYPQKNEFSSAHLKLLKALNYETHRSEGNFLTWRETGELVQELDIPGVGDGFVILAKTGTAADIPSGKLRIHSGGFLFTIMTQAQYRSLENYIRSGYQRELEPRSLGLTGMISLQLRDSMTEDKLYYSKYARGFLESRKRLRALLTLSGMKFQ